MSDHEHVITPTPWQWQSGPPVEIRRTTYTIRRKSGQVIVCSGMTDTEVVTALDFYGDATLLSDRFEVRQTPLGSTMQAQIVDHRTGEVSGDYATLPHAHTVCLNRNEIDGWMLPLRLAGGIDAMTAIPHITPDHIEQEFAAGNTRIMCCPVCGACIGTNNEVMVCTDDQVALYLLVEKE